MICAGIINDFRDRVADMETELHQWYRRRDEFTFSSKEWMLCQNRINKRQQRLSDLRGALEKMMDETLPEGTWGHNTSHAA